MINRLATFLKINRVCDNPKTSRALTFTLTLNMINKAVEAHIANEQAMLDLLPAEARKQLDEDLVTFLSVLEAAIDES